MRVRDFVPAPYVVDEVTINLRLLDWLELSVYPGCSSEEIMSPVTDLGELSDQEKQLVYDTAEMLRRSVTEDQGCLLSP